MHGSPSPTYPRALTPEYIEAFLASANMAARRVFCAQGLDGQLRQNTSHDRSDVLHVGGRRLFVGGQ